MPYLTRKNLKLQLSPGLVASGAGLFWDTTHTADPHGGLSGAQLAFGATYKGTEIDRQFSTGMGNHVHVQFPVQDNYLSMWPVTQVNSAWPSLHG